MGYEVYESETGELACELFERTVLTGRCHDKQVVIHADNGAPQRSSTLRIKLDQLGLRTSYSHPRVSNDNAYSESLFRTAKYRHDFPVDGFENIEAARKWVLSFVRWYNNTHRHSTIKFVTPCQRHEGKDVEILTARKVVYRQAKELNPNRWSKDIRDWERVSEVWLIPEKTVLKAEEKVKKVA